MSTSNSGLLDSTEELELTREVSEVFEWERGVPRIGKTGSTPPLLVKAQWLQRLAAP